ncbi:hypothetical protein FWK35_00019790 [Aphis craccivora]|uniref:Uncharacterized protein n=1 Tax=Aphis craccivora TaxID=307492 RepID=A0A6G0YR15_APHCR|nr:hypothetical protein FWK35_00019790 [Aphis craccivora]
MGQDLLESIMLLNCKSEIFLDLIISKCDYDLRFHHR